jgi:hypothetical protein
MSADLILRNGRFTTLDRSNSTATAVAITGGVFSAVGRDHDVMQDKRPSRYPIVTALLPAFRIGCPSNWMMPPPSRQHSLAGGTIGPDILTH